MTDEPQTQTDVILADQADALPGQWIGSDINLMHEMWPDLDVVDFRVMLRVCMARGLNPLDKELYPVVYNKNKPRGGKNGRTLVLMESVDAMRRRAHSAGLVRVIKGPQFCGEDLEWKDIWVSSEPPVAARFGIKAKGMEELAWATRLWSEASKRGQPGDDFWRQAEDGGQPVHMLGLAAERQGWRQFCPGIFSNMYGANRAAVAEGGRATVSAIGVEEITWAEDVPALEEGDVVEHEPPPPAPDPEPGRDAAQGRPDDGEYSMDDVIRALWPRMRDSTPPWGWEHLEAIAGWPKGAAREQGIRVLLTDAVGSADELADMVFSALEATRS